jgi:hypothetical protein
VYGVERNERKRERGLGEEIVACLVACLDKGHTYSALNSDSLLQTLSRIQSNMLFKKLHIPLPETPNVSATTDSRYRPSKNQVSPLCVCINLTQVLYD